MTLFLASPLSILYTLNILFAQLGGVFNDPGLTRTAQNPL